MEIDNIKLDYMISEIYYHELGQKWDSSDTALIKSLVICFIQPYLICAQTHEQFL